MTAMDALAHFAAPGPMTDLAPHRERIDDLPADPVGIARVVQGLVLHPFWAASYGVEVPPDHVDDVQIRSAAEMVDRILAADPRPLDVPRAPVDRFSGNCRHFSVLTVALLRAAGVPSRARCGFGGYFEPGRWVDHWIVEHWDGHRWVVLDPQIDDHQRRAIGLDADPADLPPGAFLAAGEAWIRTRDGRENADRFGILDMWGAWFIVANVARDLAALNKVEMLPWDGWGSFCTGGPLPPGGAEAVDEVAALTQSGDLDAIRARYRSDEGLRVPPTVTAFATSQGPVEVDVRSLV